jgi:Fic family protein
MMTMKSTSGRAGRFMRQPTGYKAFVPSPLPPDPPLQLDGQFLCVHEQATIRLGRLEGLTINLPNPDLFLSMFVRKEAVLSSQIEGTQASLEDVLAYEVRTKKSNDNDAVEVVNYVRAMNHGLKRMNTLPLSLRLIREIHAELLRDVRGGETINTPGEFRTSQNWIGHPGTTLRDAAFVPPPPHEMNLALHDLEKFLHVDLPLPILLRCGLLHAQFETIHPFLDGNGRVGRLLIALVLCHAGLLQRPLLYLSYYFKANREEYYERLNAVRQSGDWEGWLAFFLRGVAEVAQQAAAVAEQILKLRERHVREIHKTYPRVSGNALRLLDLLFDQPYLTATSATNRLGVSTPTANTLIARLQSLGMLREVTGESYGRVFAYEPYLALLREGTLS